MPHLSFSQLSTLLGCPEKHRRHYLLGHRGNTSGAIIMGQAAHVAPEIALKSIQATGMKSKDAAMTGVKHKWAELAAGEIEWGDLEPEKARETALGFGLTLYEQAVPAVRKGTLHAEWGFNIPIPSCEGWTFKGNVDHIRRDGKRLIVDDWKTTSSKWTQSKADSSLQVQAYFWAIWQHFGEMPKEFQFHIVNRPKKGETDFGYDVLSTDRAQGLVEAFTDRLRYAVKVIGLHERDAPSDQRTEYEYHKYCEFRKECTPWESGTLGDLVIL